MGTMPNPAKSCQILDNCSAWVQYLTVVSGSYAVS
jgi:hypothetical protein